MTEDEISKLLSSRDENFLKQLKLASLNELEYWEGGSRPENLQRELLKRYLSGLDTEKDLIPNMEVRKSSGGKFGASGFDWVFTFEDDFIVSGVTIRVYIKGFFFEKDSPRGVEIQSFKRSKPRLKSVL